MIQCQKCLTPVESPRALCAACDMDARLRKITVEWFEKHLEAFAVLYPQYSDQHYGGSRPRLAQHLYDNLAQVLIRAGDSIKRE